MSSVIGRPLRGRGGTRATDHDSVASRHNRVVKNLDLFRHSIVRLYMNGWEIQPRSEKYLRAWQAWSIPDLAPSHAASLSRVWRKFIVPQTPNSASCDRSFRSGCTAADPGAPRCRPAPYRLASGSGTRPAKPRYPLPRLPAAWRSLGWPSPRSGGRRQKAMHSPPADPLSRTL